MGGQWLIRSAPLDNILLSDRAVAFIDHDGFSPSTPPSLLLWTLAPSSWDRCVARPGLAMLYPTLGPGLGLGVSLVIMGRHVSGLGIGTQSLGRRG